MIKHFLLTKFHNCCWISRALETEKYPSPAARSDEEIEPSALAVNHASVRCFVYRCSWTPDWTSGKERNLEEPYTAATIADNRSAKRCNTPRRGSINHKLLRYEMANNYLLPYLKNIFDTSYVLGPWRRKTHARATTILPCTLSIFLRSLTNRYSNFPRLLSPRLLSTASPLAFLI